MSQVRQILHERNEIRHRLVIIKNGIPTHSPWCENHQVGLFNGVFFHVGGAGSAVPNVFRVSEVAAEVL